MSLRFFADHCVPTSVIQALRDAEHSVFVLRDHIATDSEDGAVIAKAQELDAILVSLNGDFSDIVTFPPLRFKGIVAIQVRNHPEAIPAIIRRLDELSIGPRGPRRLCREIILGGRTQNPDSLGLGFPGGSCVFTGPNRR